VAVKNLNETVRNQRGLNGKIPDPSDRSAVLMTVRSRTIPPDLGTRFGKAQGLLSRQKIMIAGARPSHWHSVDVQGLRMNSGLILAGTADSALKLMPYLPKTGDGTPTPPPSMVCVEFFQNLMTPFRRRVREFGNIDEAC
jgi:hypothetical protein